MRTIGAIVLLCAAFTVAIGGETANLKITNQTAHVLTITIADRTWKAVAAGAGVTYASAKDSVEVTASYAPDQEVSGSVQRVFHLSTHQGSYTYIACAVNAPIPVAPMEWNVTADTLAAPAERTVPLR